VIFWSGSSSNRTQDGTASTVFPIGDHHEHNSELTHTTPVLKLVKDSFREEVSALLHEGMTAEEIHALVSEVIKNGLRNFTALID